MPVAGLSHVNFRGSRALIDRLRDFYVQVIGLEQGARPPFASFGYWLYAGGEAVVHLSLLAPGETRSGERGAYDHVALACTDLPGFEARLRAAGIAFRSADVPLTRQRQLFLVDPAGNGVELNFELPPR